MSPSRAGALQSLPSSSHLCARLALVALLQALYSPDDNGEPAIRVRDNGRVEVLTKNLYDIPVPKKMRGIVKQEFDQLGEEHKVCWGGALFGSLAFCSFP